MKTYRTVHIERDEKREDQTFCDLCGCIVTSDIFEVDEVTITHRTGYSGPGGGDGKEAEFDVCGSCFKTVIASLFTKPPRIEEWDY